ncbi:hypothetical protein HRbin19_00878 [bacterium HR19]|nr:hypothetical protein HRbin19_00878 [bacterium HR19]
MSSSVRMREGFSAFVFWLIISACFSHPQSGKGEDCKPLYAFYYPWYGTPDVSGEWRHWNIDGHNPDKIENGKRDIASVRHPYPDVYDSSSEETIRMHIELAKKAKITGFIFSWWGRSSFEDHVLRRFAEITREEKFPFSIYYEGVFQSFDDAITEIDSDLLYLSKYFQYENYIKIEGKPVLFLYGRGLFPQFWCAQEKCPPEPPPEIDWSPIIRKWKIFFIADDISFFNLFNFRDRIVEMGFKAVHAYNPYFESYFLRKITDISEYEKIFGDYVEDAKMRNMWIGLTILPGYDDRKLKRQVVWELPRNDGETLKKLYEFASKSSADAIVLVSFNEWHEGTEVEPSQEFGDLYIKLLSELRRNCK